MTVEQVSRTFPTREHRRRDCNSAPTISDVLDLNTPCQNRPVVLYDYPTTSTHEPNRADALDA